jgi:Xaa-Pro aminopeptidase
MRGVKTKSELSKIRKACEITDKVFLSILKVLKSRKVKTEVELRDFILSEMKKHKVKKSFDVIVASGSGGAEPHHVPDNITLKGFTVIDFGVIYKGFMSDMTRTVFVGEPSEKDKNIYNKLLECQEKSVAMVKDGLPAKDPDIFARDFLGKDAKYFIHTLGHGLGKKIHEHPKIFFNTKFILRENMAITIEPGVYYEGKFGIRIEDTCIVGKKGPDILTKSNKKLLCV